MESISNTIKGFVSSSGNQPQSGSEPVSGQTGSGTTDQPYDAGNTTGQSGSTGEALGSSDSTLARQAGTSMTGGSLGSSDSTLGRQSGNTTSGYSGTAGEGIGSSDSTLGRPSGTIGNDSSTTTGSSYDAQSSTTDYASRGVNPFIADIAGNRSDTTTGAYSGMEAPSQQKSVPSDSAVPTRSGDADYEAITSQLRGDTTSAQTGASNYAAGSQTGSSDYATGTQTGSSEYATGAQTGSSDYATGAQTGTAGYTSGNKNKNIESEAQEPPRQQTEVEDPSRGKQSDDIKSEQDKKDSAPEDSSETKEHKSRGETWTGTSWVKFDKVNAGDPEISSGKELEEQETAAENAKADAAPSAAETPAHKEGMKEKLAGDLHMGHHNS
ncbi:hypothetical protein MMC27_002559 [Xylographa pallens]|nr:hypothetical protein [Xylographa pallens]